MTPAFYNRLWLAVAALLALLFLCSLAGCSSVRRTAPASTAAVRAPLLAANANVARALAIGRRERVLAAKAVSSGLAAGSEEARELSTLTLARTRAEAGAADQLSAALYQTGSLQRELDERQHRFDALATHDRAETAEVGVLTVRLHRRAFIILGLILLDYFFGAPIQGMLHVVVRAAAAALVRGWHLAFGLFLRCWPLLAAFF